MPLDARFEVADILVGQRATHYWDNEQRVSETSPPHECQVQLVWDAFFVFGPDANWKTGPPGPLGRRSPVVEYMATLKSLLQPYLE